MYDRTCLFPSQCVCRGSEQHYRHVCRERRHGICMSSLAPTNPLSLLRALTSRLCSQASMPESKTVLYNASTHLNTLVRQASFILQRTYMYVLSIHRSRQASARWTARCMTACETPKQICLPLSRTSPPPSLLNLEFGVWLTNQFSPQSPCAKNACLHECHRRECHPSRFRHSHIAYPICVHTL